jgi:hypothetical protein
MRLANALDRGLTRRLFVCAHSILRTPSGITSCTALAKPARCAASAMYRQISIGLLGLRISVRQNSSAALITSSDRVGTSSSLDLLYS